ncbi:MAG: HlyD family secretion protein [Planctomycetaceae bacterium]
MIELMALSYAAILWLVFKQFKLVPLNKWSGLTAVFIGIGGITFLLLMMNAFQPYTQQARYYFVTTPIVPQVSGEVVEVPVEPNTPLNRGDVLFRIDPRPFQAAVDQLQARLEGAKRDFEGLQAAAEAADAAVFEADRSVDVVKAEQESAAAAVAAAEAAVGEAEANRDKTSAVVATAETQVTAARRELGRVETLGKREAASASQIERATMQFNELEKRLEVAKTERTAADHTVNRAKADLEARRAEARATDVKLKQLVEGELPRTRALARQARAATAAKIGDEHASIAAIRAQLVKAEYDLAETTVRAPTDGYVTQVALRPGFQAVALPLKPSMVFVHDEEPRLVAAYKQNAIQAIEPGLEADIAFLAVPGKVFHGKVVQILPAIGSGGVTASGGFADAQALQPGGRVLVEIKLESDVSDRHLPAGSDAMVAVYTHKFHALGILRKVLVAMKSWENYLFTPGGGHGGSGGH